MVKLMHKTRTNPHRHLKNPKTNPKNPHTPVSHQSESRCFHKRERENSKQELKVKHNSYNTYSTLITKDTQLKACQGTGKSPQTSDICFASRSKQMQTSSAAPTDIHDIKTPLSLPSAPTAGNQTHRFNQELKSEPAQTISQRSLRG